MPIHDWTRLEPGDFHHFHQVWTAGIANSLNSGLLPPEFMAMVEQVTGRPIPDVVTLQSRHRDSDRGGGTATQESAPKARLVARVERSNYVRRKNRVVIRHGRGDVVAIIEIVSPGNKDSRNSFRTFVEKMADILNQGVNLLVVDLFPPTKRDPQGMHKALWDEFTEEEFKAPPGKPLIVAAYLGGDAPVAYVESMGVGDPLPAMPVFLSDCEDDYVLVPLEATYNEAWAVFPAMLKKVMNGPGD